MREFKFSSHALLQMADRKISAEMVLNALYHPVSHAIESSGQEVYQGLYKQEGRTYLLRVFVNSDKKPVLIKTVYKTSKIRKYYEGKI